MDSTISRIGRVGLGLAALLAAASIAAAETVELKADLKGTTTAATGNATVTYDTASKQATWRITYSGLSGPPTAAHFHGPAQPGANAGVAVLIPNAATSPVQGSATLTDAQAADLLAGRYYINIHTAANPAGETAAQSPNSPFACFRSAGSRTGHQAKRYCPFSVRVSIARSL